MAKGAVCKTAITSSILVGSSTFLKCRSSHRRSAGELSRNKTELPVADEQDNLLFVRTAHSLHSPYDVTVQYAKCAQAEHPAALRSD